MPRYPLERGIPKLTWNAEPDNVRTLVNYFEEVPRRASRIGQAHSEPMTGRRDSFAAATTPRLSRDAVAAATLALIDERGLTAATMRAIAHRLGVKAQSLYTHIANREDLLDAVADRIVSEVDSDPAVHHVVTDSWQLYLIDTAHAVRRSARRHRSAFVLVATRPAHPVTAQPRLLSDRWVTNVQAIFQRSGFTDDEIAFAYRAFDAFLLGSLLIETRDLATKASTILATRVGSDPTRALTPANHGAAEANRPADQHDDDFAADLDDIIGRIATKVERASRPRGVTVTGPDVDVPVQRGTAAPNLNRGEPGVEERRSDWSTR